jgi:hypothetical protein
MASKKRTVNSLPTWDQVKTSAFSPAEIAEIDAEVDAEVRALTALQDSVSSEVAAYMAREGIGFNELTRRLGSNPRHTARLVKGNGNLTMASIAAIAALVGKRATVVFEPE